MLHSIEEKLQLGPQKLLATYQLKSVSFPSHLSQAVQLDEKNAGVDKTVFRFQNTITKKTIVNYKRNMQCQKIKKIPSSSLS